MSLGSQACEAVADTQGHCLLGSTDYGDMMTGEGSTELLSQDRLPSPGLPHLNTPSAFPPQGPDCAQPESQFFREDGLEFLFLSGSVVNM